MKNSADQNKLLLPEEASGFLRISLASFYKRVWAGQIPVIRIGRSLRVDEQKLLEILNDQSSINS